MGSWKKILGFFFLTIFILVKVSAFHVFTHQNEDQHHIEKCLVCSMAMDMQKTAHVQPDVFVFEPLVISVWLIQSFETDHQVFISNQAVYSYFSRPPPSLLS